MLTLDHPELADLHFVFQPVAAFSKGPGLVGSVRTEPVQTEPVQSEAVQSEAATFTAARPETAVARSLNETHAWSEALVRWHLPDGTVRGPDSILPYWMAAGRIEEFTRFTLLRGTQALAQHPEVRISVNLSPEQLLLPETLRALEALLPSVTSRLHIEVTEEHFPNTPLLTRQLRMLRERCGVVLLDDVTPSDLRSRFHLDSPVDGVKIDRSVVTAALSADRAMREPARSFIMEVCERFAIVVAEGIEDLSAAAELRSLGVSHLQGFGIAKPNARLLTEPQDIVVEEIGAGQLGASAPVTTGSSSTAGRKAATDGSTRRAGLHS